MDHDSDSRAPLLSGRSSGESMLGKGFNAAQGEALIMGTSIPEMSLTPGRNIPLVMWQRLKRWPRCGQPGCCIQDMRWRFLIFFVNSFKQETTGTLSPYVYSAFDNHSLISTTRVLTSVIESVVKLPIAKLIDVWGRPEGFLIMKLL
ncbi:hypothetical protein MW887_007308 [Aspergillus wentii]|nr:hypothetical protein MW887_007308 [Aspergillus wentii]